MQVQELLFKLGKKIFHTNLFVMKSKTMVIFPINKFSFVLNYKPRLEFPNILCEYDDEGDATVFKIKFIFAFGFYFLNKKKPKVNPIIYELFIKFLINLFLMWNVYKMFL